MRIIIIRPCEAPQLLIMILIIIINNYFGALTEMINTGDFSNQDWASESGFLTKVFTKAAELATIGLLTAVAWQIFLDPIFFPIFHDPTNIIAQSWVSFIREHFGWISDLVGFTGGGGILNTDIAQSFLAPHQAQLSLPVSSEISGAYPGGLSMEGI